MDMNINAAVNIRMNVNMHMTTSVNVRRALRDAELATPLLQNAMSDALQSACCVATRQCNNPKRLNNAMCARNRWMPSSPL